MKIVRNPQNATLTFVPVETEEEKVIASITAVLTPKDKLVYGGRTQDGNDNKFCIIQLHAGGHKEDRSITYGNLTIHKSVFVDSVELVLQGSTEEDKHEVDRIRDMCFFGSSGLIFLGETEVKGKKAIVTTGMLCKHCGAGMISLSACEWKTCSTCATNCEHNYVRGATYGGGVGDIGIGEFCNKCGRCKPKAEGEREKSEIEHHLEVERELGIVVIYKNGPLTTPHQVVEAGRLARRYEKSRRRTAQ